VILKFLTKHHSRITFGDPEVGLTQKKSLSFASLISGLSFCQPFKSKLFSAGKKKARR
jgi:hypothetical protein